MGVAEHLIETFGLTTCQNFDLPVCARLARNRGQSSPSAIGSTIRCRVTIIETASLPVRNRALDNSSSRTADAACLSCHCSFCPCSRLQALNATHTYVCSAVIA
jgi:hypothetical protein